MAKKKFRLPSLTAALAGLGALAAAIVEHPQLVGTLAGKSTAAITAGAIVVLAILKPVKRQEHER